VCFPVVGAGGDGVCWFSCESWAMSAMASPALLCSLFQPRQQPYILPPMHVQCGEHYSETHTSQGNSELPFSLLKTKGWVLLRKEEFFFNMTAIFSF
jgi:hypothetical protein